MRAFVLTAALPVVLSFGAGLLLSAQAQASDSHGRNGSVILRMCKSADRVKMLSVMCQGYLDGYLDAARHYGKGKAPFCLGEGDRQRLPAAVVAWIESHPESLGQPAAEVLQRALAENFPCRGKQ